MPTVEGHDVFAAMPTVEGHDVFAAMSTVEGYMMYLLPCLLWKGT